MDSVIFKSIIFCHILLHVSTSKVNVTIIIFYITSLSPLLSSHSFSLLDISLISASPLFCIFLSFFSVFVSFFYCSFLTHSLSLVTSCLLSQHQLIPSHLFASFLWHLLISSQVFPSINLSSSPLFSSYNFPFFTFIGFLNYLFFVGNQSSPALVHSLSYGDIEQVRTLDPHSSPLLILEI